MAKSERRNEIRLITKLSIDSAETGNNRCDYGDCRQRAVQSCTQQCFIESIKAIHQSISNGPRHIRLASADFSFPLHKITIETTNKKEKRKPCQKAQRQIFIFKLNEKKVYLVWGRDISFLLCVSSTFFSVATYFKLKRRHAGCLFCLSMTSSRKRSDVWSSHRTHKSNYQLTFLQRKFKIT